MDYTTTMILPGQRCRSDRLAYNQFKSTLSYANHQIRIILQGYAIWKDLQIAGFAYVDDTDLTQSTSSEARTATEVLQRMHHGLDTWEALITSTGGALSNEKSRWWFVDFRFNQSGDWSYKKVAELLGGLTTIDIDGVRKPIQCLEPEEPHETLGMFLDATDSGATTEQDAPMG